jgi:hypothetical protein
MKSKQYNSKYPTAFIAVLAVALIFSQYSNIKSAIGYVGVGAGNLVAAVGKAVVSSPSAKSPSTPSNSQPGSGASNISSNSGENASSNGGTNVSSNSGEYNSKNNIKYTLLVYPTAVVASKLDANGKRVSIQGKGTIISSDKTIDCGKACLYSYTPNSVVGLKAVPDANSIFEGWRGDVTDKNSSASVIMNKDKKVSAIFAPRENKYSLKTNVAVTQLGVGAGGKIVGQGIDCEDDCFEKYNENSKVTLTAIPNDKSVFIKWSPLVAESSCSGKGVCTLTMNSNKDVEADFGLISKTCGQAFLEALGQALGSKLTGTESQASVIEQILKNQTMSKDQKDDHIRSVQGSSCYFRTF